ncbi:PREDICTED: basic form of pathogenesis-related protein 1-like [Prunus mume]|uniref:Basic form of pathogenesis-related protein 1-like n=1 Tax=Prunus mume TaxID=102107 RepID=A0ABM0NC37_PRUMU|nr:PREDICTED: basic form of pathogenesis-related protein 1-like [Prunus mume]
MVHSQGPYGENLAEGYGEMTGGQAMKFWVTEKPNYDYASNTCVGDVCGHYTQVVWRNSTHVGCARAKCKNGWMFVICVMLRTMEIREDIGDQSSEGGSGVNFHKPMLRPSSLGSGVGGDHLPH